MISTFHHFLRAALSLAAAAALLTAAAPAALAATLYDNLSASQDFSDPVYPGPLANSFSTGASGGQLLGIKALLMNLAPDIVSDIQLHLLADDSAAPGAMLVSLGSISSAAISSTSFQAYSFAPVAALTLDAHARYWVEFVSTSASGVQWSFSSDTASTGVAGEFSSSPALGIVSSDQGAYQMAVAAVPEPETYALMLAGLALLGLRARGRRTA